MMENNNVELLFEARSENEAFARVVASLCSINNAKLLLKCILLRLNLFKFFLHRIQFHITRRYRLTRTDLR